jgi:uridine kinase
VVLIGGNTRTGKSTLASYFRINFEKAGRRVLLVGLDNWLLPEDRRDENMNVYDRFRLKQIEPDIADLLNGRTLRLSSYSNHPERASIPLEFNPEHIEVIIIEGVVALSSENLRHSAHMKLFTTLSPETFRKRIDEYYDWRGRKAEETDLLFKKRELDEYQLIEKESKLADLIIN